jgi:hypothetical protein
VLATIETISFETTNRFFSLLAELFKLLSVVRQRRTEILDSFKGFVLLFWDEFSFRECGIVVDRARKRGEGGRYLSWIGWVSVPLFSSSWMHGTHLAKLAMWYWEIRQKRQDRAG